MNVLGLRISRAERSSTRTWSRRAVAVAAGSAVLLGAGTAYAVWSTTGTGTGTAQAGQASPLATVSAAATTTGLLYPNGPAGDLRLTFDNPNPFAVKITSVSAGAGVVAASKGIGTCTTTGVSLVPQANVSIVVPARGSNGDGQVTQTLPGAVVMDGTSDSGCQGATFAVPVSFTGVSN